jgi:putative ABC transport system substrate-binding protein
MKRRDFLALTGAAIFAGPLRSVAQQRQMKRVGFAAVLDETDPDAIRYLQALRRGLARQGWVEPGVSIETRGGATAPQAQQNVAALIKQQPDVFVALAAANVLALKAVTSPIVFVFISDNGLPSLGIVNNAHPGGNITGFATLEASFGGKWFSVLKELSPRVETAALFVVPTSLGDYYWSSFASAAQVASVKPLRLEYHDAGDVPALLLSLAASPSPGLVIPNDPVLISGRTPVIAQVAKLKIPTVWGHPLFTQDGGVLSYNLDPFALVEGAGEYAGLILNGTRPGDLPVQFPSKFSLVVNLKAAQGQSIEVPQAMIVRAEELIQ